MQIIGVTRGLVLLLVVFVDRSDAENEVIRIISARKADKFEEKIYAAHITNQNY